MIRLFKVYYPLRTLILLVGEAMIVWLSFVTGMMLQNREDSWLLLNVENGYIKILAVTCVVLLFSHWFDLYDSSNLGAKWDQIFRLLLVLGFVALALSAVGFLYPSILPGNGSALAGLIILTFTLLGWRAAYSWMVKQPFLRERVYVLGTGERAQRLVTGLRERSALGIEVVGWTGDVEGELTRDMVASHLMGLAKGEKGVHRVIVAMPNRRGTLPVEELLDLRLGGVKVEEATSWLEKITGRIEVEQLYPSWLIFAEGFRFSSTFKILRRLLHFSVALVGLLLALPLLPLIVLAIRLDSRGSVLYRQQRVGRRGVVFYCYKFRTMRMDAEVDTGATWATDDDPRITYVGKFLRSSRLDEIPQLWCVLKGDMHFVGPRPERPEFVQWLSKEIPYYGVRHMVRPGITGWAQVQYKYGNTLADAREKLQYDLFYIKNASLGLDLLIMFQTIKIVLLGRGAQ
ncbi:MAG: exopolysaccharide biosynthesis polyprenyl glycosylphosphotransferase [Candidatus Sulfotelmatobacter sp.]|nr:exopolysaccharide biosynthesis polyprenyl glycosylphosphotransferase [Candidatus Sulfotelmatobacter sp.]